MEAIITILFIIALFVSNITILNKLMKLSDETLERTGFILLAGVNVLSSTIMVAILHPHMLATPELLFVSGFLCGAAILGLSTFPFKST